MTIDTVMTAASVPDTNKVRSVMADKKEDPKAKGKKGKFQKAYKAKFGEKFPPKDKK